MLSLKLPRLLSVHQVPKGYQEQGILFGYRPPHSSATDCLLSAFQMTNETLNIWTHFVPAWWVPCWALQCPGAVGVPWGSSPPSIPASLHPSILASLQFPMPSSNPKVPSCAQEGEEGLAGPGTDQAPPVLPGSALAYSAYVFPLEWVGTTFHHCYVPVAVLNTIISTSLSCYSRFLELERPRLSKACRTLAFVYPYLFDSIPLFYRLSHCAWAGCPDGSLLLHCSHTGWAFLTCFIFATHLPERWAPGHFDYIGHSHQVFHVCGILGTHFQLEAILLDLAERQS
ncbi:PAQR5 protein, partial [Grallaria varia]|nr:PAQR5 protein [Grallaria varia]